MKRCRWLLLLLLGAASGFTMQKSELDLDAPGSVSGLGLAKAISLEIKNDTLEATLIEGGYFTLGTKNGLSDLTLDNSCDIAYGHPYAMTSHPVVSINGSWTTLKAGFALEDIGIPDMHTLSSDYLSDDGIAVSFSINLDADIAQLTFSFKNTGEEAVQIQPGVVYDPSLGEHGDAALYADGSVISSEAAWTTIPKNIQLWERNSSARGIGVSLDFDTVPAQINLRNWRKIYTDFAPDADAGDAELLYDLTMGIYWDEMTLEPGDSTETSIRLALLEPEFYSELFMRWDIPNFLTIEDNIMFPTTLTSTVDIWNQGEREIINGVLHFEFPELLDSESDTTVVTVSKIEHSYPKVEVEFPEIFEDQIMPLKLTFQYHGNVLDSLTRNVYVPATPLADTGLVVTIDSVFQDGNQTNIIFDAQIELTGWKLASLRPYNVIFYENGSLIDEFNLGISEIGGSNLADVAFVLDCSGSMGNEIDQVRQYIGAFGDELNAAGYDFRVAVVTFSTDVDDVWDFTDDLDEVRSNLASITLWGGTEDSPWGMMRAMDLSFRPESKRTIIWITDEPYRTDRYTVQQVVNRALQLGVTIHGIGLPNLQTDWFDPIILPTGGNFYDIDGNFLDILLDVSRMEYEFKQQLSYESSLSSEENRTLRVEVHYGGRGGYNEVIFNPGSLGKAAGELSCYPNPFNPELTIQIQNPQSQKGELRIYNMLGQTVFKKALSGQISEIIRWKGESELGSMVSSGCYLVRVIYDNSALLKASPVHKVLYLK